MDDLQDLIENLEGTNRKRPNPLTLPPAVCKKLEAGITYKDPLPDIPLDETQIRAKEHIFDWIANPDPARRTLALGGYAGTGKTTLLRHVDSFLKETGLEYSVLSFMGKSVSVLKKKGITQAETCHSHIYDLDEKAKRTGELKFQKKPWIDDRLLIVDEAQVINAVMDSDMMSYPHTRVFYVGDHGQLKPIGEDPDIMGNPDIRLEVPHRQALGSNILQFAHAIRKGQQPRYGKCPGVQIRPKTEFDQMIEDPKWDQIIVGFNRTRHFVNSRIREIRGHFGKTPDPGEKVIFLNNNRELGLYNGMTLRVESAERDGNGFIICDLVDFEEIEPGKRRRWKKVALIEDQLGQNKLDVRGWIANAVLNQNAMLADYAYAITAHKALGSEWDRVLALEEIHPDWEFPRWRYTVITRAAQEIGYCYAPVYLPERMQET